MAPEILIVDDEDDIRILISETLKDEGYETRVAGDADSALEAIRTRRPHLVILDIWLQGSDLDGLQILEIVVGEFPGLPVVMISGHGNIETAVATIKNGAYDFIEKPFKAGRLLVVVERAIEAARLRRENEELRLRAGGDHELTGSSSAINNLRQIIAKVAPNDSRVLITGPAGAGKEVVARMVHAQSRRAAAPFVVLNCATMRPEHMEIELFGAEAGADGAGSPSKVGTFEQAHSGTLFLDEVADMPLETQGKIVRVLQEQTFQRAGGGLKVEVDVRVLASSNRDLQVEIDAGRFRADLFYRLSVVPVVVPALRERRADIPVLARYFMEHSAASAGTPAVELGEDAIAEMQAYHWPGNVRQLRNIIDWLLIMGSAGPGKSISAAMLPPEIRDQAPQIPDWDKGSEVMALPLREAREIFEREYLAAQVTRFGGNISRTAAFVGMERSALHRKLKTLGVNGGEKIQKYDA